ncbi:MAG: flagellar basal body L-ring protein FlgH [bacterium]
MTMPVLLTRALVAATVIALLPTVSRAQAAPPARATQMAQTAQAAPDSASSRPFRRSWTSDRREFVVGDIITVVVDELTLASASKGQNASDTQSRDLGLSAPSALDADVKLGTDKSSSSRQNGQATRDLRFRGELSVRVTKIQPNGVLEVNGTRTVDVDKNKQQLSLTGLVRPEDVTRSNVVASARVADAQLLYTLSGNLGATRGGIIGRLISVFWP